MMATDKITVTFTLHECATIAGGWLAETLKRARTDGYIRSPERAFAEWSLWCAINSAHINERGSK